VLDQTGGKETQTDRRDGTPLDDRQDLTKLAGRKKRACSGGHSHSRLGVASFITVIVAGILLLLVIVIAPGAETTVTGFVDVETAGALAGILWIAFAVLSLAALGLGVLGILDDGKKRTFALLGATVSVIFLVIVIFLVLRLVRV